MNLKQGTFIATVGTSIVLGSAWLLGLASEIPLVEALLTILMALGLSGVIIIVLIGTIAFYEVLGR